jgi:choline-sulfatase
MPAERPNVVLFMTDQQRGATVLDGHRLKAITPRLDALRAEGVTFSRSYTVSPHCCPSRASFFTGRYPTEHGVWNNVNVANALSRGPYAGTEFWSTEMAAAGYRLGFCGKWHVSNTVGPGELGWQECGAITTRQQDPGSTPEDQQQRSRERELSSLTAGGAAAAVTGRSRGEGEIIRPGYRPYVHYTTNENPFGDEDVVDSAVEFIADIGSAPGSHPWCLYVGTLGPHDPYQPPRRFLDLYDPDEIELPDNFDDPMHDKPALYRRTRDRFDQLTEREHREALRHYLAFCSYEDELFGRVYDAVAAAGQLEQTIFVYLSDHGDYAGDHGLWCKGLPAFESALHIPTIIGGPCLPAEVRGRSIENPISIVDFAPTLMELCGVPTSQPMSGISFSGLLTGAQGDHRRSDVFFQSNGNEAYGIQRVIMDDRWKLVVNYFDHDELYDLAADPGELTNLLHRDARERKVGVNPDDLIPAELRPVVAELYRRLWRFALDHDDDLTNDYIMTALGSYGPGVAMAVGGAD